MPEAIPFNVGRTLSPENPTVIPPGTATASFTAAQGASKYRIWNLLAAASPANLPTNLYRAEFYIDNTGSSQAAIISQNGTTVTTVPAGARYEGWRLMSLVGTEAFVVTMGGTTATACVVGERSYI